MSPPQPVRQLSRSSGGEESLCCCEYINMDGQRTHMLACCCDCEAVDQAFDKWVANKIKDGGFRPFGPKLCWNNKDIVAKIIIDFGVSFGWIPRPLAVLVLLYIWVQLCMCTAMYGYCCVMVLLYTGTTMYWYCYVHVLLCMGTAMYRYYYVRVLLCTGTAV